MPAPVGEGVPQRGDRSARNTHEYPDLHASDIEEEEYTYHNPWPMAAGQAAVSDGTKNVPTDIATQAELNAHTGDTNNPHVVTADQVGLGNVANLLDNLSAAAAPTAGDDSADGYAVGSRWVDTTNGEAYVCLDATEDAAIWLALGGGGSGSGGTYRQFTYVPDGAGSWAFVVNGDGMPVFAQLDLED